MHLTCDDLTHRYIQTLEPDDEYSEFAISKEFKNKKLTEDEEKSVCDIPWIWATVMPAMWW